MSDPMVGEIRVFGFNFAPRGWALCNGQLLSIEQNRKLYTLVGTAYGGDGDTTFALPDLRGRTPVHRGAGHVQAQEGGSETVVLSAEQIGAHTHVAKASSSPADNDTPANDVLAAAADAYRDPEAGTMTALRSGTVTDAGEDQAHNNMQPYTTLSFCIALRGRFPAKS